MTATFFHPITMQMDAKGKANKVAVCIRRSGEPTRLTCATCGRHQTDEIPGSSPDGFKSGTAWQYRPAMCAGKCPSKFEIGSSDLVPSKSKL